MPQIFKNESSKTRVILDATEIPIAKPSNPISQRATYYSGYKNTNTIKILVGSTPGGVTSHCSQGYGGATSDRQMIERSPILDLCDEGDSVMADKRVQCPRFACSQKYYIEYTHIFERENPLAGPCIKA